LTRGFASLTAHARCVYVEQMAKPQKKRSKAVILGLGLDSDGHKRLTTGPNFILAGGTQETHDEMTEKVIKFNEKLAAKGKQLENASPNLLDDIAHEVGMKQSLRP
jgi:hypothetical protein